MQERFNWRSWKDRVSKGTVGSNPTPSANEVLDIFRYPKVYLRGCAGNHAPELRRAERGGNTFGQLFESHPFRQKLLIIDLKTYKTPLEILDIKFLFKKFYAE